MGIKDLTFATCNLCKHIRKIVVYIVLTGKRCLGPNIWPKTCLQARSTKNKTRLIWNTETIYYKKFGGMSDYLLFLTDKKIRHLHVFFWCVINVPKIDDLSIDFELNDRLKSSYYKKNPGVDRKSLPVTLS